MSNSNSVRDQRTLLALGTTLFLMLTPAASMATIYECHTEKELEWLDGELGPATHLTSRPNEILQFNDEEAILWAAYDDDSNYAPLHFDISQKMDSHGKLTAVSNVIVNTVYISTNVFRLSRDKAKKIVFLYYISGENRITTGTCHIGTDHPLHPLPPELQDNHK